MCVGSFRGDARDNRLRERRNLRAQCTAAAEVADVPLVARTCSWAGGRPVLRTSAGRTPRRSRCRSCPRSCCPPLSRSRSPHVVPEVLGRRRRVFRVREHRTRHLDREVLRRVGRHADLQATMVVARRAVRDSRTVRRFADYLCVREVVIRAERVMAVIPRSRCRSRRLSWRSRVRFSR